MIYHRWYGCIGARMIWFGLVDGLMVPWLHLYYIAALYYSVCIYKYIYSIPIHSISIQNHHASCHHITKQDTSHRHIFSSHSRGTIFHKVSCRGAIQTKGLQENGPFQRVLSLAFKILRWSPHSHSPCVCDRYLIYSSQLRNVLIPNTSLSCAPFLQAQAFAERPRSMVPVSQRSKSLRGVSVEIRFANLRLDAASETARLVWKLSCQRVSVVDFQQSLYCLPTQLRWRTALHWNFGSWLQWASASRVRRLSKGVFSLETVSSEMNRCLRLTLCVWRHAECWPAALLLGVSLPW